MKPIRQQKAIVSAGLIGLLLLAASCGGGGGGSTATPTPTSDGGTAARGFSVPAEPAPPPCGTPPAVTRQVNNPLFPQQWYLANTGQDAYASCAGTTGEDINLSTTMQTGLGIKVAVVDTGMEIAHEDLAANVVAGGSWDFNEGDMDPTNPTMFGDHGTSVAGLIAMDDNNMVGGVGVAPGAKLEAYNFLTSDQLNLKFAKSLGDDPLSEDIHVFNQSFGTTNNDDFLIDPAHEIVYLNGVTTLRGGLGALYVKAAGNGFDGYAGWECTGAPVLSCQNANMDPANALLYNIVVGAVNADGIKSSYSTAGSAIWISAPGGEFGFDVAMGWAPEPFNPREAFEPAMITTDQSGCDKGFSHDNFPTAALPLPPNDFEDPHPLDPDCKYTSTFNGTSSSAPVTSGVIALMLEANADLTWRDVKHILATTATKIDPDLPANSVVDLTLNNGTYRAEQGWVTNGALPTGYSFHNWYGFGRVNANAAVTMADPLTYTLLPPLNTIDPPWNGSGTLNLSIPDDDRNGVTHTINLSGTGITLIEAVQIRVTITHPYVGVLGIELISPNGSPKTRSVLLNAGNGFNTPNLSGMVLLSNAFYGEDPNGNWMIKVVDVDAIADNGTLNSWSIRIYGH